MRKYFKLLLFLMLFITVPVFASVDDFIKADDTVNIKEPVDGTVFYAGNTVDVESDIDGILFTAGNIVETSGKNNYLFAAGNSVRIDEVKTKDAFIAGNSISVVDSEIERDLYVTGSNVDISSNIGRNAYVAGSSVKLSGVIKGNITIGAASITISDDAVIEGTLKYSSDSTVTISDGATIGNKEITKSANSVSVREEVSFGSRVTSALLSFINKLVIGLLLLIFVPKLFKFISEQKENTILTNLGFGFISLIFVPIASLMLMFTMVGLSVGIILLVLYMLCVYLTTILTGYYLSKMLLGNKIKNEYGLLTLGILVIYVLKLIPFIGTIVGLCSLCIGLGLIVSLMVKRK